MIKFVLTLNALDVINLPAYKGSTLRGGFGNAFKKVVCAIKNKDCDECMLKAKCIYSYVFETPPSENSEILRKYEKAPHPFIIEPPLEQKRFPLMEKKYTTLQTNNLNPFHHIFSLFQMS